MDIAASSFPDHCRAPLKYSLSARLKRFGVAALTISAFSACASARRSDQSEWNRVTIRVVEDSVSLARSSESISFNVNAAVRNDLPRPVLLNLCGMSAQRDIDDVWYTVWTSSCFESLGFKLIPAGASITIPVSVYASVKPDRFPQADPRLTGGRYRLLLELVFAQDSGTPVGPTMIPATDDFGSSRPSTVFVVADPTSQ
jgi:hypothetical protein